MNNLQTSKSDVITGLRSQIENIFKSSIEKYSNKPTVKNVEIVNFEEDSISFTVGNNPSRIIKDIPPYSNEHEVNWGRHSSLCDDVVETTVKDMTLAQMVDFVIKHYDESELEEA